MRYALFLRGVNVAGIKVESAPLRDVLSGLGVDDPRTYLASGNVTFGDHRTGDVLKPEIEDALSKAFGYEAHVLLLEHSELSGIVAGYPFEDTAGSHRYAILCDTAATAAELAAQRGDEQAAAAGAVVYWSCPKGETLASPFSKVLGKRIYQARTTNRNVNTLEKMLEPPAGASPSGRGRSLRP